MNTFLYVSYRSEGKQFLTVNISLFNCNLISNICTVYFFRKIEKHSKFSTKSIYFGILMNIVSGEVKYYLEEINSQMDK